MKNKKLLIPLVLITSCFALWGFANDITNPMVEAFSNIFLTTTTESSLVQMAFYGGYFAMAIPAAMFIRRYTYKSGVLMGLGLYALGAFMFFPAKATGSFYPFLIAYFVLTCGLSFLETSCNPYILALGPRDTAVRRLNMAQAFNPIGSLCGMWVAMNFIQARLDHTDSAARAQLDTAQFEAIKNHDLSVLIGPYLWIGVVILVIFFLIYITKMPAESDGSSSESTKVIVKRLFGNSLYRYGVVAQFFYVGVQIMCWTFITQYGMHIFMGDGMEEHAARVLSQKYNIVAMVLFCSSRFISTFLMRYVNAAKILTTLAIGGAILTLGVIFLQNIWGLYCLVGVSACMSIMFPTIYGIALGELTPEETKLGAAGLIMAILGGSVLPPLQATIIDCGTIGSMPAVNVSFVLPLFCFIVVCLYGVYCKDKVRNGR